MFAWKRESVEKYCTFYALLNIINKVFLSEVYVHSKCHRHDEAGNTTYHALILFMFFSLLYFIQLLHTLHPIWTVKMGENIVKFNSKQGENITNFNGGIN